MTKENHSLIAIRELKKCSREHFLKKRAGLSLQRKEAAAEKLFSFLSPLLKNFPFVLSFASLPEEISLSLLNDSLAKEKKLLLPKQSDIGLIPYRVDAPHKELKPGKHKIWEPIPEKCVPISFKEIPCILVPGICFDRNHTRIGYGKGYYDRFLCRMSSCWKVGLGFVEQLSETPLPKEEHDQALDALFLF